MPVFGDYETIDPPLFMSGRHGPVRTYWLARRRETEDGRVFVVKTVALPKPTSFQEGVTDKRPTADPSAFAESVARLQGAYRANPELIIPVHASGKTETELWYATDYYPQRSLAEFESTAKDITNEGLANVVESLASACLTFQRATGRSHGNLKPGNVLLAGQPGPLRSMPLRLSDPAGLPPIQASAEQPAPNAHSAIRDATEILDLRGIGQIILQLVESNPIEGPEDYALPIENSAPWRALGKHSQRWLELCNRLLDPGFSLDEIRLASLVNDDKDGQGSVHRSKRKIAVLAALSVLVIGGIASFPKWGHYAGISRETGTRIPTSKTQESATPPAPNVAKDSAPALMNESSEQASTPSRFAPNNSLPLENGHTGRLLSPGDMPLQIPASVPSNGDAGIAFTNPHTQTTRNDPEAPSLPSNTEPATQEVTAQSPDTMAPARGSLGQSTSSSSQVTDYSPHTEFRAEASNSKPEPVSTPLLPGPSPSPTASAPSVAESAAGTSAPATARANPEPSQASQEPQRIPAQQRSQYADPKSHRAASSSSAARVANNSPRQTDLGSSRISRPPTAARPEARTSVPTRPVDVASLDRQLRSLESDVGKVVAVPRNSAFFTRLNSLEAQYAKANRLSGKTKKRLDLLRANLTKKMPGPSPEQPLPDPLFAPSPTPYPVGP